MQTATHPGAAARDSAIAQAADHAERVSPDWNAEAYRHLCEFIDWRRLIRREFRVSFMVEEARSYAESQGLPAPPDPRAWGGVVGRAVRERKIKLDGYGQSNNPQAHRRPTAIWRCL